MASIRERNGKFNVIYSYTNEKGERKQKWETYETKAEAKRRKKEIEYKKGGVEIDEYISRCMSNLSLDLETRKIDFLYRNDVEKGTCLYIDEEKIKRVFYNVIGNAYKYIDKDLGMIFLHIEDAGKMVWVRITDNGSGIEKDELPLIFERFYRTDSSRNSKTGGTGLGLSIVKHIAMVHGADIKVKSTLGKGTTITVTFKQES